VGLHFGVGVADALAQIKTADQRRDAAGDVDHGATREIQRGDAAAGRVQQPSHAPDHVGHRTINDERPERQKDRHGAELHAFGKGAGDQRRGDDGEHQLVDHEGLLGNGGGVVGVGGERNAAQEEVLEAADEGRAVAEGQRVAHDSPENGDQAHHGKALHHGGEDVLLAHQAAIEQSEAGPCHQQNQAAETSIHALSPADRASVMAC